MVTSQCVFNFDGGDNFAENGGSSRVLFFLVGKVSTWQY